MDLNATHLGDEKAGRLVRVSMIVCFVVASVMLIASLAMAHGPNHKQTVSLPVSTLN